MYIFYTCKLYIEKEIFLFIKNLLKSHQVCKRIDNGTSRNRLDLVLVLQ